MSWFSWVDGVLGVIVGSLVSWLSMRREIQRSDRERREFHQLIDSMERDKWGPPR